jgi:hypothetical protein
MRPPRPAAPHRLALYRLALYRLAPFAAAALLAISASLPAQRPDSLSATEFAALSARLSDQGGYFDTDNLISNEQSLLHPLTVLDRRGVRGGVYVGVGPDQNFNYIARTAPRLAIIADVRRDNLLHHLLFKALFSAAGNRAEFLALWLGRPAPAPSARVLAWPVDSLVMWAKRTPATPVSTEAALRTVRARVTTFGIPLDSEDLATIARFHRAFIADGVGLRFTSTGRAPRPYYPTLGQLLAERDLDGGQSSYLASETAFRVVQSLERRNLIVPVVGDLAGPTVLPAVAALLRQRGDAVSVLYTSNVEDYLIRAGTFATFVRHVQALPRTPESVIIRSWFGGPGSHPLNVPGYYTTQLVEPMDAFARDGAVARVTRYGEVVGRIRKD